MSKSLFIAVETEELPANTIDIIEKGLRDRLLQLCKGLNYGTVRSWSTPRHIAVSIDDLDKETPVEEKLVTGPPEKAAFRDGEPTKAAIGFAKGKGVDVSALEIVESKRGPVIAVRIRTGGESIVDRVADKLQDIFQQLPYKKAM